MSDERQVLSEGQLSSKKVKRQLSAATTQKYKEYETLTWLKLKKDKPDSNQVCCLLCCEDGLKD